MPKKETLVRTRVVVTQDEGGCHAAMSGEWIQHGGPDGGRELDACERPSAYSSAREEILLRLVQRSFGK